MRRRGDPLEDLLQSSVMEPVNRQAAATYVRLTQCQRGLNGTGQPLYAKFVGAKFGITPCVTVTQRGRRHAECDLDRRDKALVYYSKRRELEAFYRPSPDKARQYCYETRVVKQSPNCMRMNVMILGMR